MITIRNETIAEVPTLHVIDSLLEKEEAPTIFFLHGFTSAKEHNLHIAYLLAQKGFRVFLPDALHHGEREKTLIGSDRNLSFWDIVLTSIDELNEMKKAIVKRNITRKDQIGLMGTSMGAITTYGALTAYEWMKAAVSFMGTAFYETFAHSQIATLKKKGIQLKEEELSRILHRIKPFDLSKQLDTLNDRSLFIWHGKEDHVVPFSYSQQLYHELIKKVSTSPQQIKFIAEDKVGHKVSRKAILEAVKWLESQFISEKVNT